MLAHDLTPVRCGASEHESSGVLFNFGVVLRCQFLTPLDTIILIMPLVPECQKPVHPGGVTLKGYKLAWYNGRRMESMAGRHKIREEQHREAIVDVWISTRDLKQDRVFDHNLWLS